MRPIPVLGTLILNRGDLLLRLFDSIDYPYDKFVILNNGKEKDVAEAIEQIRQRIPDKLIVHNSPKNTGVAGGWNFIIKNFPAPWTFICGNDVQFTPGDMQKIVDATWEKHETHGKIFGNQGHNAFTITKLAVDTVGYFDENFYPAYLEDCDYQTRMRLSGIPYYDAPDCHIIHGIPAPGNPGGSSTIFSNKKYRIANGITHSNGHRYYEAKWGGSNEHEKFTHPFNNPKIALSEWKLDPALREANDIWGV
jgi:GT2 family glycosyltransferase